MPGQVARISSLPDPPRRGIAIARGEHVATKLLATRANAPKPGMSDSVAAIVLTAQPISTRPRRELGQGAKNACEM